MADIMIWLFYAISNITYVAIVVLCAQLVYKHKNKEYKKPQKVLASLYYGSLLVSTFLDPLNTLIDLAINNARDYFLVNCLF